MFYYREGRFMVLAMLFLFFNSFMTLLVAPRYNINIYYKSATWLLAIVIVLTFIYQVTLAVKLYKETSEVIKESRKYNSSDE